MKSDVIIRIENRIAKLDQHDCDENEVEGGGCVYCFRLMQEKLKLNKIRSNNERLA